MSEAVSMDFSLRPELGNLFRSLVKKGLTVRKIRQELLAEGYDLSEHTDFVLISEMRAVLKGIGYDV